MLLAVSAALGQRATQEQAAASPAAKKAKEEAEAEGINELDTNIADEQGHTAMCATVAEQFLTLFFNLVHQQPCDIRPCDEAS